MFTDLMLGEFLLWSLWLFIWIAAIMVWIRCMIDLFSDRALGGWGKAGWTLVLVFLPFLGALIYLIARGKSMTERQLAKMADLQAQQRSYIQQVASSTVSPAEQITSAKELLDSGTITDAEFSTLKAKALTA